MIQTHMLTSTPRRKDNDRVNMEKRKSEGGRDGEGKHKQQSTVKRKRE